MKTMKNDTHGYRGAQKETKRAVYPFGFTAINRLPGAGHVIAPNTIIIPGIQGCFLIALRTGL